jgi:hypothetical protein
MRIFDQAIVFNFLALIDCCGFTVGISQWAGLKQFALLMSDLRLYIIRSRIWQNCATASGLD